MDGEDRAWLAGVVGPDVIHGWTLGSAGVGVEVVLGRAGQAVGRIDGAGQARGAAVGHARIIQNVVVAGASRHAGPIFHGEISVTTRAVASRAGASQTLRRTTYAHSIYNITHCNVGWATHYANSP